MRRVDFQPMHEIGNMLGELVIVFAAESDIEIFSFAEHPAVALQVGAEVELRFVAFCRAITFLRFGHLEFDFLCRDYDFAVAKLGAELTGDRAEVSTRADYESRFDIAVGEPAAGAGFERFELSRFRDKCAGPFEQIRVEFDASDAVAHRFVVLRFDDAVADDARPKALDGLDRAAAGSIVLDVELQLFDYCGRDPASADLIARERLLVQHQHVDTGAFQKPCAGGACWATAYDQYFAALHVRTCGDRPMQGGDMNN